MLNMPLIILLKKFCNNKYNTAVLLNKVSFQSNCLVSKVPYVEFSFMYFGQEFVIGLVFPKVQRIKAGSWVIVRIFLSGSFGNKSK